MNWPVRTLGAHLSNSSSRRGFLVTLGKAVMVGGGILAGVGSGRALANCSCPTPCCSECPPGDTAQYAGCCFDQQGWHETVACYQGITLDCYAWFPASANCPQSPVP